MFRAEKQAKQDTTLIRFTLTSCLSLFDSEARANNNNYMQLGNT
jgi:hypothetical protein